MSAFAEFVDRVEEVVAHTRFLLCSAEGAR